MKFRKDRSVETVILRLTLVAIIAVGFVLGWEIVEYLIGVFGGD